MRTIKRNSILRPCKFDWPPEIRGDGPFYAVNPYIGCAHNCSYCWARDLTYRFRKPWGMPDDFKWDKPLVVENAIALLHRDMERHERGRVLFSSMTDPYQPISWETGLTGLMLCILELKDWPISVLTKADDIPVQDLETLAIKDSSHFGASVTDSSLDAMGRLRLLRIAKERFGLYTFASLEPWPLGGVPRHWIWRGKDYVDFWIIGSLNKAGKAVNPEFYKRELPPLIEWMDKEGINYYIKKELRRATDYEPKRREWPPQGDPKGKGVGR